MKESNTDQSVHSHFSTRDQINKYFRYKWLFLFSFIICLALCFVYVKIKTPLYGIYASIVIKDEKKGEPSDFPFRDIDVFDDRNTVDNESEIIRSKTIITEVTRKMGLNINYYSRRYHFKKIPFGNNSPVLLQTKNETEKLYETPLRIKLIDTSSYELLNNGKIFNYGEWVTLPEGEIILNKTSNYHLNENKIIEIAVRSVNEAAQNTRAKLSVAQTSKNASMLNLAFLHPDPEQGIEILDAIILEYNKNNHRYRESQTEVAVNIIQQRLNLLTNQLNAIENKEEKYKSRMGITELSADTRLFLDKAKESDNSITEAQIKMEVLKSIEQYAFDASASPMPPTSGLNDPVLLNLLTRISELELERSELVSTVGQENSVIRIKNRQIEEVRNSILENIRVQKQNIQSRLNRLAEEKERINAEIRSVPVNERNLARIMREKNIHGNIYNYLLQKREEANISAASEYSKLRIVDSSFSSVRPVKPDKLITFFTGLLIAIAFPVIIINTRDALSKRISDPSLLNTINAQVIGEISWDSKANKIPFMKNGHSFISEQFRALMAKLGSEERNCKSIMITSSEPAEGKSFISTHLVEVLATWGSRTILVDADLRKGRPGKNMNIAPGTPGLSDFLADENKSIRDIIYDYNDNGNSVHLITSGSRTPDIFKLLAGNRLTQLFAYLRENYEYIIINTPPVKLVSDALLLAKYADVTLYVVRNRLTSKNSLRFISGLNKKKTLGRMYLVLNDSPDNSAHMARKYKTYFDTGKIL